MAKITPVAKTTPADVETPVDFDAISLDPTEVVSVAPRKTVDDIPASIRAVIDAAHGSGKVYAVTLPNGTSAQVFARHVRDYTYLHEPRWTARLKVDGETVRYKIVDYTAPQYAEGKRPGRRPSAA